MAAAAVSRRQMATTLRASSQSARRSYAAAARLDYDYYEDIDLADQRRRQRRRSRAMVPMVDGEGSETERGVQWVILGEPGAKKHVYADRLSKLLEVPHISMGSLVRQQLYSPSSSIYKQIESAVYRGKLVPEDIIFELLSLRLEEGYRRGENGFILDGIPRTQIQAEILDEIVDIDLVLNFKHSDNGFLKGHLGSGSIGSQIKPISFNEEAVLKEKLRNYEEQGKALEDYYRKQRKLLDFHVASTPGETWQGLLAALHLQHMSSPISSHKLTA